MENKDLKMIEEKISYSFKEIGLLKEAFTRKSFSSENGGNDNDVLEFYGDSALKYSLSRLLSQKYGFVKDGEYYSECTSGDLTNVRSFLEDGEMLSHRIDLLGFAKYMIVGKGDITSMNDDDCKEDLFEAIIGAIDIDSNHDQKAIDTAVAVMLNPEFYINTYNLTGKDSIQVIQEYCSIVAKKEPDYHFNKNSNNEWMTTLSLNVNGNIKEFEANATTKKLAKRIAASNAFNFLSDNDLLKSKIDWNAELKNYRDINPLVKLNDLTERKLIEKPIVESVPSIDSASGKTNWKVTYKTIDKTRSNTEIKAEESAETKKAAMLKAAGSILKILATATVTVGAIALGLKTKNRIK